MAWLEKADMKTTIRTYRLDEILDNEEDNAIFDEAAATAEELVKDRLVDHFDTNTIFNTSGSGRPKNVLQWVKYLTLYLVYERIPDELVPERVVKNYDDTLKFLDKVAEGRVSINLPRKLDPVTGATKTKFRWGSVPKRSH